MRRVLDMTQVEFAKEMDLAVGTISRWEPDARGVGGMCEKLLRRSICALLYKEAKARPYDPAVITHMRFTRGQELHPLRMVCVRVNTNTLMIGANKRWSRNSTVASNRSIS